MVATGFVLKTEVMVVLAAGVAACKYACSRSAIIALLAGSYLSRGSLQSGVGCDLCGAEGVD